MSQSDYILTPEQFAFMQQHHEAIEHAYDIGRRERTQESLDAIHAITNSEEYRRLFGTMLWDDAYDRYQDTPGYDPGLRLMLIKQLQEELEAGLVLEPPKSIKLPPKTANGHWSDQDLEALGLVRLEGLFDEE